MGKTKKSFIDRKNASVYRLVHPTVHGDTEPSVSDEGLKITPVFQKVRGAVDYFSEEEEEEPYREDSGDEEEFGNTQHEIECEASGEEEGDEDDEEDEFDEIGQGEGGATASETALKRNVWLRSKEETMSEYSSWSSRSASSYLPPARRKQLWRDIDEFGLPDDGYDYSQHLRNAGAGVRIDAKMSGDLLAALERKRQMAESSMSRAEREVLSLLHDSEEEKGLPKDAARKAAADEDSDEEAPPLEDDMASASGRGPASEGFKSLEYGAIVEEGDELPEDFVQQMMGADGDEDPALDCGASAAGRASRLVDDQFDVMLQRYEDAEIGELPDEHPGLQGRSSVSNYYDLLDKYIAAASAPDPGAAEPRGEQQGGEEEAEEDVLAVDEEERAELAAKTRALAVRAAEEGSSEEEEEVVPEEHEAWDCESILSTYSNLYNHPALIRDGRPPAAQIRLDPRTGAPRLPGVGDPRAADAPRKAAAREAGDGEGQPSPAGGGADLTRRKEESKEEKAARKQAAKEVKARALEKKREDKAGRACKGAGAAPNAFDPRARTGVSVRHLA